MLEKQPINSDEKIHLNFSEAIRNKFKTQKLSIDFLVDLLSCSKSAAYNRFNGNTQFTLQEAIKIANSLNLSIDQLIPGRDAQVTFTHRGLISTPQNSHEFLQPIQDQLSQLQQQSGVSMQYVTNEIPIFMYFFFPSLVAFKLYIWGKNVWNWEDIQFRPFSITHFISKFEINKYRDSILDHYLQIDSSEIWNSNILNNTLSQIRYYKNADLFASPQDADQLLKDISSLLKHVKMMAAKGSKFPIDHRPEIDSYGSFELYNNEFIYTNNTILVSTDQMDLLYTTFDNPNHFISTDKKIITYTKKWFENVKKSGHRISSEAERYRINFFKELQRNISNQNSKV